MKNKKKNNGKQSKPCTVGMLLSAIANINRQHLEQKYNLNLEDKHTIKQMMYGWIIYKAFFCCGKCINGVLTDEGKKSLLRIKKNIDKAMDSYKAGDKKGE